MHEAHKRVLISTGQTPAREKSTKKIWYIWKAVVEERCGVGSETLLFVRWNTRISKFISTNNISLKQISACWCRVFVDDLLPHCMAFYRHLSSATQWVDPQGSQQAEGLTQP